MQLLKLKTLAKVGKVKDCKSRTANVKIDKVKPKVRLKVSKLKHSKVRTAIVKMIKSRK